MPLGACAKFVAGRSVDGGATRGGADPLGQQPPCVGACASCVAGRSVDDDASFDDV